MTGDLTKITNLNLSSDETEKINAIAQIEVRNGAFILLMKALMANATEHMTDAQCRSVLSRCQAYGSIIEFKRFIGINKTKADSPEDDVEPEEYYNEQ